jgi:magnesium transporter
VLKKFRITDRVLFETDEPQAPIWVFANPDAKEKALLTSQLNIDEHTLASTLDPDEPSQLEWEADHWALIFKYPRNYSGKEQFLFKVASRGVFLYPERLVVVMSEDIPLFVGKNFSSVSSIKDIFLGLIANSIHHYLEHLKIINMISDRIEKKISVSMENKHLLNLFNLEKSLVYYLKAINSNGFIFEKLKNNGSKIGFSEGQMEWLDDILIENSQSLRQAEIYSNILASLMDARASIVGNNLNILMKTLNLITIGIMVPTLVVSIFSMNVEFPLRQHPSAFWMIIGLAFISVASVMLWWRYRNR